MAHVAPVARFAGTHQTVRLSGYQSATGLLTFVLVTYVPGSANNGHYGPDPADAALHRLPIAARVSILSASEICSSGLTLDADAHPTQPCSKQQLIHALAAGKRPLAHLTVDPTDQIARIEEIYQP